MNAEQLLVPYEPGDGPQDDVDGPALHDAGSMATVDEALAFLQRQVDTGSTAWRNLCESLCRQAYRLPAHYSSANLHAAAIPQAFRHGHEPPSRGDLALMVNNSAGHIVVCTGRGWEAYTNDAVGPGRVSLADVRDLARWCGASSWYIGDAWWSSSQYRQTHGTSSSTPTPPAPVPNPERASGDMFLAEVKYGSNGTTWWLVSSSGMVNVSSTYASSWTGARMKVSDEATWRRMLAKWPQ